MHNIHCQPLTTPITILKLGYQAKNVCGSQVSKKVFDRTISNINTAAHTNKVVHFQTLMSVRQLSMADTFPPKWYLLEVLSIVYEFIFYFTLHLTKQESECRNIQYSYDICHIPCLCNTEYFRYNDCTPYTRLLFRIRGIINKSLITELCYFFSSFCFVT